jgi:lipopolysaccharide transport system ATP-binding protein
MSSDLAISIRGVSKAYRIDRSTVKHSTMAETMLDKLRHPFRKSDVEQFMALKDVSFDVKQGDVVGIIGRNGAGKSTLLKILSRITEPTTGDIDLYGRVGSLLEVGTGFHPELTGRENIYLNGQILGMRRSEISKSFDAIVDFAGVEKFLETPVKRYSSGMYVRLAFAVAAHLNPEILVVDEVLAVGDMEFQKKCLGTMENVSRSGRTVLFVSHNESAVRRLCKRAVLLEKGSVTLVGTPSEAFTKYKEGRQASGFSDKRRIQKSPHVKIVNASLSHDEYMDSVFVSGVQPTLEITVEVSEPTTFAFEVILRDANSLPILFAPAGLSQGFRRHFDRGTYRISSRLLFPVLADGAYSLDLIIGEPGISAFDNLEEALVFSIVPTNNPLTGWVFRQSMGQGCALLGLDSIEVFSDEVYSGKELSNVS